MTEKGKMISGKIYDPSDKELTQLRQIAHRLCTEYNVLPETDEKRGEVLKSLGINGSAFYLQGPVQFDYGCFTTIGVNSYANFNFTCVDCCPVTIGDNVFMAFVTFASQPASIFTGWYKVMFLTVIPAGFISLYPVELIKNFNLTDLGIMVGGCSFFFILAVKFFYFGLRRYTSGNRFGVR